MRNAHHLQYYQPNDTSLSPFTETEVELISYWTRTFNLHAQGKLSQALDLVHEGLESHPENPYLLIQAAEILLDQNNPYQAETVYDHLLEVLNRTECDSTPDTLHANVDRLGSAINSKGSRVTRAPQYRVRNGKARGSEQPLAARYLNHLEV